jgi:hypothetical protein
MRKFLKHLIRSIDECGARSSLVVKALSSKPEGCTFEARLGDRILSIYVVLPAALWPWGLLCL